MTETPARRATPARGEPAWVASGPTATITTPVRTTRAPRPRGAATPTTRRRVTTTFSVTERTPASTALAPTAVILAATHSNARSTLASRRQHPTARTPRRTRSATTTTSAPPTGAWGR